MKKRGTAILIKKIKMLLTAFTFASLLLAQPRAYAEVAPPNPAFVKYMEQAERRTAAAKRLSPAANTAGEEELRTGGYVPSPLNWSHLAGKTWRLPGDDGAAQSGGTAFNNCWTHSAMAATESNLIRKGLADTSIDLSEWYLTYYALNPYGDMPGFTNTSGEQYYLVGGNDWKAVALLSRGTGSVTTAKVPDITSTLYDYSQVYAPAVFARDYKEHALRLQPGLRPRRLRPRLQARQRALPRRFRHRERTVGGPALGRPPRHDKARDNAVRRCLSRHTHGRYGQQQLQ